MLSYVQCMISVTAQYQYNEAKWNGMCKCLTSTKKIKCVNQTELNTQTDSSCHFLITLWTVLFECVLFWNVLLL